MNKRQIMTAFNNHLMEFCQEVIKIFPENYNLQTAYKFLESLKRFNPKKIIEKAVKGMLPKNKLGSAIYKNLKVFIGDNHGQEAQKPKKIDLKDLI